MGVVYYFPEKMRQLFFVGWSFVSLSFVVRNPSPGTPLSKYFPWIRLPDHAASPLCRFLLPDWHNSYCGLFSSLPPKRFGPAFLRACPFLGCGNGYLPSPSQVQPGSLILFFTKGSDVTGVTFLEW